jgi:hypothetical protein
MLCAYREFSNSKIKFYQCLNKIMKINTRDIIGVMGDTNAKAGAKNEGL